MNRTDALEQLKQPNTKEQYLNSLTTLHTEGSVHDLGIIISFINNAESEISTKARLVASTIICESLVSDFSKFDDESRRKLAQILDSIDANVVADLAHHIKDQTESNQLNAVMVLGLLKNRKIIKHLLTALAQDKSEKIRATAIHTFGNFANRDELPIIMKQLTDEDSRVRANTVEALEKLGSAHLILTLKRIKYDTNNRVRANVLKAIFTLGDHNIEQDLIQMLDSREEKMILSGLWVMQQVSIESIILCRRCENFMENENEKIRESAFKAIEKMKISRAQEIVMHHTLRKKHEQLKRY